MPFHVLPDVLPDSPFSVLNVDLGPWKERALWWPGAARPGRRRVDRHRHHYALGPGPAGVHFLRRLVPPNRLKPFLPEHLLVGHGTPVHGGEAAAALLDALNVRVETSRRSCWKGPGLLRGMQGRR